MIFGTKVASWPMSFSTHWNSAKGDYVCEEYFHFTAERIEEQLPWMPCLLLKTPTSADLERFFAHNVGYWGR
jgi:hypothetical protein